MAAFRRSRHSTPPPQRLERAIADLHGHRADGSPDTRPWLDHGRWGIAAPLGAAQPGPERVALRLSAGRGRKPASGAGRPGARGHYRAGAFPLYRAGRNRGAAGRAAGLRAQGGRCADARRDAWRAGPIWRAGFRATAPWPGPGPSRRPPRRRWARRCPPARSMLRALMAELERLANHLGDIGAICNDAAMAMMLAQCGVLREQVLRAADAAFGHRFMRDRIVPGGVTHDLGSDGDRPEFARCWPRLRDRFPLASWRFTTIPPRCSTARSAPARLGPRPCPPLCGRWPCWPRLGPRFRCPPRPCLCAL